MRLKVAKIALFLSLLLSLGAGAAQAAEGSVVRAVYFYSNDCPHCITIIEEVLPPLQEQYGEQLEIKMIEVSDAEHYEMLIRAEEMFDVAPEERGLPTMILGNQVLIGEDEIRGDLACMLDTCLTSGGTAWPEIPGLSEEAGEAPESELGFGSAVEGLAPCDTESAVSCDEPHPIWVSYFYQVGCQACSRVQTDLEYVRTKYPQLIVEEYNVYDHVDFAQWLAERAGREDVQTPAVFVGADALIGEAEITPQNLEALAEKYAATGAEKPIAQFEAADAARTTLPGIMTVVFAGLVDGLNPCAFATLIFFVSYLTLSGRKGREVLVVGVAFTLGVFTAYLVVGMGFYKVLDLLGGVLTTLGRWVYALTGLLCAVLAILSFRDFLKAREGEIGDMALNLPHKLRMRINAVIRKGRKSRAFVLGSFATGLAVSLLELACTGQVYLPTIIFVMSQPQMRVRAFLYLVIYNLLFILPLVVVFVLTYYGTGSKQLTQFLQRRAATVKLGLTVLFATLAVWLFYSVAVT
jgi:cytochrome c biogenesis protein CcdA/thiol-disulfide isomerase/thioredoxin